MKITFLGTGTSQGVPVIGCQCDVCKSTDLKDKRLRSSLLIETDELTLVIDAGPDFRQQMLRENVTKLDAILLTHEHKDHIGGLDDVRAFNFLQNKPMDVYARASVHRVIKREFNYVFAKIKYPGIPQINNINIRKKPFYIGNLKIIPVEAVHYSLKIFGYRINDFAYLTDLSHINEEEKQKLKNLKVFVVSALRQKQHYSHYNLSQALDLIDELLPNQAYLTHISHLMGKYNDIKKLLPNNVAMAYDGLKIFI